MQNKYAGACRTFLSNLFVDREIYMRSNGELRFLTLSARLQRVVAGTGTVLLLGWLVLSGNLLASQIEMLAERNSVAATLSRAQHTFQEAKAQRQSAADRAARLEARQRALEAVASDYFPFSHDEDLPSPNEGQQTSAVRSPVLPASDRLLELERRQQAFVRQFDLLANERAARAERAVAALGIDVDRFASGDEDARGGPYLPLEDFQAGEDILRLAESIERLDRLERALLAVPSFMPAEGGRLTSSFGLRRDPFTRRGAMHSGQDFGGAYRSTIRAAAPGRVVRAGWWGGYGRAVVIDHGGGIRTRYAHLSAISVSRGDHVDRGDQVGAMGSTGRSTGTHLHFEVRIDGRAVNPRPFLESPAHVIEIQANAGRRLAEDELGGDQDAS